MNFYKVYAQHEGAEPVFLCTVGSLEEANAVIAILDRRFADDIQTQDPRVRQMEGTAIYAESTDGTVWVEIAPGIWEKSE
jgi:hypothetical protein